MVLIGVEGGSNVIPVLLCHNEAIDVDKLMSTAAQLTRELVPEWSFVHDLQYGLGL